MHARKSSWVLLIRVGLLVGGTVAFGLAFWNPLRSEERAHALRVTSGLARSVQTDIADEVGHQMRALVRLARLLSFEGRLSRKDWESQAKLFMRDNPGFLTVQWVDATHRVRWVATDAETETQNVLAETDAPIRRALAGMANRRDVEAEFTPAFRLWNGNIGRRMVVPIGRGKNSLGFVIAVIDEPKALANILSDHSGLDYGIAVLEDHEEIYRMPGSSVENEKSWAQDAEVRLPGARWRIRVWPEPKMLRDIGPDLSELGLLTGSLIGMLLFLTLDFSRTSYFRLRELRRTRDELELRVAERTAELQLSNQALGTEIDERKEAQESLQELSGRLLQLRDEEQRRIARELHDSTVQIMGALAIDLEKIQHLVPGGDSPMVRKLLADSSEMVERATAELRTISYLLHPPILDDFGLAGALSWYASGFSSRSGIQVRVDVQRGLGRLPRELELTLFRVVQEALTNAHRHSGSPTVDIEVVRDVHGATLQIVDHGHGMPPGTVELIRNGRAIVGVGIAGMRERVRQLGGSLEIESDDKGTLIRATLPFEGIGSVAECDNGRGDNKNDDAVTAKSENTIRSEKGNPGS
jgi:signal transduction histidine kinase/sensor domain CHASE-containing protein